MDKLGQLVFTGVSGTALTEEERAFIEEENIGGVVIFKKNFESPAQLAELINSIQVLRKEYPLFIAVDHEGGRVHRFGEPFSHFPPMLEVARLKSPKICYEMHAIMADELRAVGINVNFAPVCDILTNLKNKVIGDRAFGSEVDEVSKFVSAAIRGLQTNGILACAKHFPGHGSTIKDSHEDLPYVKRTIEELQEIDYQPFIKAVKARVPFFMMAHLVVDAIDPENPISLSSKAHDIVRNELRFSKIIISDDMEMGAITEHFPRGEAAVKAIQVGTDVVEYRTMEGAQEALEALKKAYRDKTISAQRVDEAFSRVNGCKKEYLKEFNPVYIPSISKIFANKSREVFLNDVRKKLKDLPSE